MKNLITLIFLFTLCIAFGIGHANSKTGFNKWSKFAAFNSLGINGGIHSRVILKRRVGTKEKGFEIANVSITRSNNLEDEVNLQALSKEIARSFKDTTFQTWKSKNAVYLKGEWKLMNRMVYIKLISPAKNELVSIFSLTRPVFFGGIEKEIRAIDTMVEKQVLKDKANGPRTSLLDFFGLSSAHAQLVPDLDGLEDGVETIGDEMGDINDNMEDAVEELDELNDTAADLVDEMDQFNDEMGDLNDNIGDFNDQLDDVNQNWADTNAIFDKAFDTKFMARHGAIVGAATAAGAALGGFLANLAIDGVVLGLTELFKVISGKERRERLWKEFQNAQDKWDEQRNQALDVEKKADALLGVLARVEGKNPEEVVEATVLLRSKVKNDEIRFKTKADEYLALGTEVGDRCADYFRKQEYYATKDIEKLDKFLKHMDETSSERQASEAFFCHQLWDLRKNIVEYNNVMNQFRLDILAGAKEWKRAFKKQMRRLNWKQRRVNAKWYRDRVKHLGKKVVRIIKRKAESDVKQDRREFLRECRNGKNEVGVLFKEQKKEKKLGYKTIRKACKKTWEVYLKAAYDQDMKDIRTAAGEANAATEDYDDYFDNNKAKQDRVSQLKFVGVMERWFTDVAMEMECARGSNNAAKEAACMQNYPKIMGPIRALKKIEKAYADRGCFEKYKEASESVTGFGYIVEQMQANNQ